MESQLKQLIEESGSILVTSHIGPDGDSVSSSLLLYQLLKLNYPDKQVAVSMEEEAPYLSFVKGYDDIRFQPLDKVLADTSPNLLIILDANNVSRITRQPELSRPLLRSIKTAIIDHHEPAGKDDSDVYINNNNPSVAQDVYEIFIERLGYRKPDGYAQTAMLGIYTDTGGFIYKNSNYRQTLSVVARLIEEGADLEFIVNRLNIISEKSLLVVAELIKNMQSIGNCTYSFLSDDFISSLTDEIVREGSDTFRSSYLRNISGRPWGFLVYKDLLGDQTTYSVSFRALSDTVDVSKIAVALGGGGHKPAAGAKIKASSVKDALDQVKAAVEKLL